MTVLHCSFFQHPEPCLQCCSFLIVKWSVKTKWHPVQENIEFFSCIQWKQSQWDQSQNILSQKGPTRIIKSSSWLHPGPPNNKTICLRALIKYFLSGAMTSSLGSLLKCPTTLLMNNLFLIPNKTSATTASSHSLRSHYLSWDKRWEPSLPLPLMGKL